jgi:hypothetical protein
VEVWTGRIWARRGGLATKLRHSDVELRPGAQNHRPLYKILQLANIAGPIVISERFQRLRWDCFDFSAHPLRMLLDEVTNEQRDVLTTALAFFLLLAAGDQEDRIIGLYYGPYPGLQGKSPAGRLLLPKGLSAPQIFVNRYKSPLTASGFRFRLRQYVEAAAKTVPTISKKRVTPHVFSG